jgi:hypothetical protein
MWSRWAAWESEQQTIKWLSEGDAATAVNRDDPPSAWHAAQTLDADVAKADAVKRSAPALWAGAGFRG